MEKMLFSFIIPLSMVGALFTVLTIVSERIFGKHLNKSTLSAMCHIAIFFYILPFGIFISKEAAKVIRAPLPKLLWPQPFSEGSQIVQNISVSKVSLSFNTILSVVWIVGIVFYLANHCVALFGFSNLVKKIAEPCERWEEELLSDILIHKSLPQIRLIRVDKISGPALFGILQPVILLPKKAIPYHRLKLALMHEVAHLERHDLLYKRIMTVVCAVHWFSPFPHLLMRHNDKIFELACDERVAEKLNSDERHEYALAILDASADSFVPNSCSFNFSPQAIQMKRRLEHIISIKKKSSANRAASTLLIVALIVCGVFISSVCTARAIEPENNHLPVTTPIDDKPLDNNDMHDVDIGRDTEIVLSLPVDTKHYVSLGFGSYGHEGIDFVSEKEGPVYAVAEGIVTAAENDRDYGNYVILNHGNGMQTLYAHCSELLVKEGVKVTAGSKIAKIGSTGQSTGPHLHFELRINGEAIDPSDMFPII